MFTFTMILISLAMQTLCILLIFRLIQTSDSYKIAYALLALIGLMIALSLASMLEFRSIIFRHLLSFFAIFDLASSVSLLMLIIHVTKTNKVSAKSSKTMTNPLEEPDPETITQITE